MSWKKGENIATSARFRRLSQSVPSSYTIWRNSSDGKYYAECNVGGGEDYTGAAVSSVTQSVINAVSSTGGHIHYRNGFHDFTSKVPVPETSGEFTSPILITGDGWNTVLRKSGMTDPIFSLEGSANRVRNVKFADLQFYSNGQTGALLYLKKADRLRFKDVLFWGGVNGSYAIEAEHSWDAVLNGCLFHGLGSSSKPIIHLYNGATNNCNNWRFVACRWERNATYNSLALESDATGAGTENHNIHLVSCKIHGGAEDASFTSGAIALKNTRFSSISGTWMCHHLNHIIDVDEDCELNTFTNLFFYTTTLHGNPTSCIRIDGQLCIIDKLLVRFADATQVVLFDTNSHDNFVDADTILCSWGGATKVTDNGTDNDYRAGHYI